MNDDDDIISEWLQFINQFQWKEKNPPLNACIKWQNDKSTHGFQQKFILICA